MARDERLTFTAGGPSLALTFASHLRMFPGCNAVLVKSSDWRRLAGVIDSRYPGSQIHYANILFGQLGWKIAA